MTRPLIAAAPAEGANDCGAKVNRQVLVEPTHTDLRTGFEVTIFRNNLGRAIAVRNDETGFRHGSNLGIAAFVRGFRGEICLCLIEKRPGHQQMLSGTRRL